MAETEATFPQSAQSEKRATVLKKELKQLNAELQQAKMMSTFTTAASMIVMFNWFASSYLGQVASRIPFESIFPFKFLVRRGLEEDVKYTPFDAGYAIVFVLASQLLRCCLNRAMGVSLPSFAANTAGNWFDKMAADPKTK